MDHPMCVCLWFDGQAKEAAEYYCSIFKDSKITSENPVVVTFELNGNKFIGLNGGPHFTFNESVSIMVNCDTQADIDHYWDSLTADGGSESQCGWLKDKYGLSWQIVPAQIGKWMADTDKAQRVMAEVMRMKKIDLEVLRNA
ncbi:MAG: VOC family protein [Saprospiraceae bacterium]